MGLTRKRVFLTVLFLGMFILFFGLNLRLLYRQVHSEMYDGRYISDIHPYVDNINGVDTGDDVTYPIFFNTAKLIRKIGFSSEISIVLAAALFNALCIPILTLYFIKLIKQNRKNDNYSLKILAIILPFVLLLISMIILPSAIYIPGIHTRYLGIFTPNPWHNQTYFAARPFAIIAWILFVQIATNNEYEIDMVKAIIFSVALLLSTMAKPSFSLAFGSTALIIWLYRLVKSKFKNFKQSILLGLLFLPTVVNLAYQFVWGPFFVHSSQGADAGIGVKIGYIWSFYCRNYIAAIFLALFFPLIVYILNWEIVKTNFGLRLSMLMVSVSCIEFLLLYEKGERFWHANFSWGYMYGIFFAFFECTSLIFVQTLNGKEKINKLIIEWSALACHLLAGIYYFIYLQNGGTYFTF